MKTYLIVLACLAGLAGLALMGPSAIAEQTEPTSLFPLTIEEQRAMAADAAAADQQAKQWQDSDIGPVEAPKQADIAPDAQPMSAAGQN